MEDIVPDKFVRYSSVDTWKSLASRLGYFVSPHSQDWEWEVAVPEDFDVYLELYKSESLTSDERFSLMEMMIQAVDDLARLSKERRNVEKISRWNAVAKLLEENAELHAMSIAYWTCLEAADPDDPEQQFYVSVPMRKIWNCVLPDLIKATCNQSTKS